MDVMFKNNLTHKNKLETLNQKEDLDKIDNDSRFVAVEQASPEPRDIDFQAGSDIDLSSDEDEEASADALQMEVLNPRQAIITDVNNFMSNISQKAKILAKQSLSQYKTKNAISQNSIAQNATNLTMSEYSKIDVGGFESQSKIQTGKKAGDKIKEVDGFSDRNAGVYNS